MTQIVPRVDPSRIDGLALRYNRPNLWLPDLLVCRAERGDNVLAAMKE